MDKYSQIKYNKSQNNINLSELIAILWLSIKYMTGIYVSSTTMVNIYNNQISTIELLSSEKQMYIELNYNLYVPTLIDFVYKPSTFTTILQNMAILQYNVMSSGSLSDINSAILFINQLYLNCNDPNNHKYVELNVLKLSINVKHNQTTIRR